MVALPFLGVDFTDKSVRFGDVKKAECQKVKPVSLTFWLLLMRVSHGGNTDGNVTGILVIIWRSHCRLIGVLQSVGRATLGGVLN